MFRTHSHQWIIAPYQRDRDAAIQQFRQTRSQESEAPLSYRVNCHRALRGPYTGTGELLRTLVPEAYQQWPELVQAHATEILSIAPEMKSVVPTSLETLTSLAIPEERTRFYSRLRTLRMTHGIIDFLHEYSARLKRPIVLVFDNVHACDPLDQEFISVLLRRARVPAITVLVGSASDALPAELYSALQRYANTVQPSAMTVEECQEQLRAWSRGAEAEGWQRWLLSYTERWRGEWEMVQALAAWPEISLAHVERASSFEQGLQSLVQACSPEHILALASMYVESDTTTDNTAALLAYNLLSDEEKQPLHDRRADALEKVDQWSLHLGAIPYHRLEGSDSHQAGQHALGSAIDYCLNMGFYEATVAFCRRGRQLINFEMDIEKYWFFTTKMTTSLAALGRPEEAEQLYKEARALTSLPRVHMQAAYATAMIYTRYYGPEKKDHTLAKGWIQEAIAIARLLPDSKYNMFQTVFQQNGLALIEVHLGKPYEALRLVSEGLAHLDRVLAPGEHQLHRSVLLYNRAQVYAGIGELEQALRDYSEVITKDPYYSEYYLDRGNLYRRLERDEEALQDYNRAITYSPPYVEAYYNRAGVLSVLGRQEEALRDYSYILELEPEHVDALLNRASILYEREEFEAAHQDVEQGLRIEPDNAQLLCTLGLLEMVERHTAEAYQAFTRAIEHDAQLFEAWTNRAVLLFEQGEIDRAINDLSTALSLQPDNISALYNRAYAYQSQQRWSDAIADYSRIIELTTGSDASEEVAETLAQMAICHAHMKTEVHK